MQPVDGHNEQTWINYVTELDVSTKFTFSVIKSVLPDQKVSHHRRAKETTASVPGLVVVIYQAIQEVLDLKLYLAKK